MKLGSVLKDPAIYSIHSQSVCLQSVDFMTFSLFSTLLFRTLFPFLHPSGEAKRVSGSGDPKVSLVHCALSLGLLQEEK